MENQRKYGIAPYKIAVIHGGPGAPGEMAPVARELESEWGILEPLQTADTLEGQVRELSEVLTACGDPPITLVGYSWGAWLSVIVTARHPSIMKKLILISSGPFEEKYAQGIMQTRLARLGDEAKKEVISLSRSFNNVDRGEMNKKMLRFGQLISKADAYDPVPHDDQVLETQFHIFQSVWKAAEELRSSGKLLHLAEQIQCPLTAIHGDYDPHPAEGVEKPLFNKLSSFRFILIRNCGHTPWIERQARAEFFRVLKEELTLAERVG
jgi:pimeloyl-ACP methyl ester carboxylesterase